MSFTLVLGDTDGVHRFVEHLPSEIDWDSPATVLAVAIGTLNGTAVPYHLRSLPQQPLLLDKQTTHLLSMGKNGAPAGSDPHLSSPCVDILLDTN
jgi:hypothetical protein